MTHQFFAKSLRNRLVLPNRIVVQSREDDDPQYSGEATDAESYALLPRTEFYETYLVSNAQATAMAEAKLSKAQLWSDAGALNVPMNVGQETYDYIKATDSREGDIRTGNIGTLTRRYTATKNRWETVFSFGNWQTVRKALADLGITSDDIENYFSRLSVGDLYAENLLAKNMGFYWLDPDNTIDLSKIGDNLDNLPDGEQYARVSTWNLKVDEDPESPTYGLFVLNMDEHTIYQPGYDPSEKRRTFTATPTTPYDVGDLWLDADTVKRCTTGRASGAYVAGDWTATTLDALADGAVFQRVKSASLTAAGLVLLDQVVVGTYGLVLNTDIQAGSILLSKTIKDGEWYLESGVAIDATKGIGLYGGEGLMGLRTYPTLADYIAGTNVQCYVGTDGKLYAGGGSVQLDSDGVKIYGEYLRFFHETTETARIFAQYQRLTFLGSSIYDWLKIDMPTFARQIVPLADDTYNLGGTGEQWKGGYFSSRLKIPVGTDLYD